MYKRQEINSTGDGVAFYDNNRIEYNGKLLFAGYDNNNGMELWESDGSNAGTILLHTTNSASGSANPRAFYKFNGLIYFSATGTNIGDELYSTDGTSSGLVSYPEIAIFSDSSPRNFFTYNNNLVFVSLIRDYNLINYGRELLSFDGSPWTGNAGVPIMIQDINAGAPSSTVDNFTELNGTLFFSADDGINGKEIWISNGQSSGTNIFLDINSGSNSSDPANFTFFNNKIYFTADDGVNGRELWVTDGTVLGTQMVQDLFTGGSGNPTELTVFNNFLIFTANNPSTGIEVFKMTTTENITLLKNINLGTANSSPFGYTVFNNELYFAADNGSGIELWKSGGFPSNTNLLADINPLGESTPKDFTAYNGKLYFNADNGTNGRELWVTDGTSTGTQIVEDIWSGIASSDPLDLIVANDFLFFSANNGSTGYELFKYQDPTLSINNFEIKKSLIIHPNPAEHSFSLKANFNINTVEVLDLTGKRMKIFKNTFESYNVKDLFSGIYIVNIQTEKGNITKKLIKE